MPRYMRTINGQRGWVEECGGNGVLEVTELFRIDAFMVVFMCGRVKSTLNTGRTSKQNRRLETHSHILRLMSDTCLRPVGTAEGCIIQKKISPRRA